MIPSGTRTRSDGGQFSETWRQFEWAGGVYTELTCGSCILMDADYGRNRDRDDEPTKAFEPSLFVWATVMSPPPDRRCRLKGPGL
jgi:3-hydroxy-D-aspartate aldolase